MKTTKLFRMLAGKAIVRKNAGVLLTFMVLLFLSSNSSAQNRANLIVTPATTITQVGQQFNVDVRIDFTGAPPSADAVEIHLTFDKTKLHMDNVVKTAPTAFGLDLIPLESVATINTNGQVNYAGFTLTPITADTSVLTITFTVLAGTGTSTPLTLLRTAGNMSDIFNSGSSILGSAIGGSVAITSGSCTLAGATISNTATCNGQPFNLVLQSISGGGTSPYSLVVNGTTYNNVNVGASFASITPPTYSFYTTTPVLPKNEDNPLELGIRFTSSVGGYIRGVRFLTDEDVDPTGTYTGRLRMADGTLLASAAYVGPIDNSTWYEVLFAAPVEITANTQYMVSYYKTGITHAEVPNGAASPITNGPLSTVAGGGFYRYDFEAPGVFNATNTSYMADVLFTPNAYTFDLTSITDAGACSISGTPLQQLNVFSPNCSTLPVTLMRLSATADKKDITVSWATASEIDNDGFELQRSSDNRSWEGIIFVKGKGNSNTASNYSYVDKDLFPRRYYYRLKQVDIDKKYKYSAIVTATIDGKAESLLGQNYPNPFSGHTLIPYTLAKTSKVNLTVFDLNGRPVKVLMNGTQDAGSHTFYFYPGSLSSGVYYYRLSADEFSSVKKLIVR